MKTRTKRIIGWSVLGVVGLGLSVVAYYAITIGSFLNQAVRTCTQASEQATQTAPQLKTKLDELDVGHDPSIKATAHTYGDCIDSDRYVAEAQVSYSVLPRPRLISLHETLQARLQAGGYTSKKVLGLDPIKSGDINITASEIYTAAGQPDLDLSYMVERNNPEACSGTQENFDSCMTAYNNSFSDLSKLTVMAYTARLSREFMSQ